MLRCARIKASAQLINLLPNENFSLSATAATPESFLLFNSLPGGSCVEVVVSFILIHLIQLISINPETVDSDGAEKIKKK